MKRRLTFKQLLDGLKETREYWKLKEEATDRALWNSLWKRLWNNDGDMTLQYLLVLYSHSPSIILRSQLSHFPRQHHKLWHRASTIYVVFLQHHDYDESES